MPDPDLRMEMIMTTSLDRQFERQWLSLLLVLPLLMGFQPVANKAQDANKLLIEMAPSPEEKKIFDQILLLANPHEIVKQAPQEKRRMVRMAARHRATQYVDRLLEQYPKSTFREHALRIKLESLAELARFDPAFLDEFLEYSQSLSEMNISRQLLAENDFYSMQGFVLGARRENMPQAQRIAGAVERYVYFLEKHASSRHVPVVRASLLRDYLLQNHVEKAAEQLLFLQKHSPNHRATRRAAGEMYRATGVGKPFSFSFATAEGESISTDDYQGQVLIVHFWASWNQPSTQLLLELKSIYQEYAGPDLVMIGVNVDQDQARMKATLDQYDIRWPQYFDAKTMEYELRVAMGVVKLPTCFITDRSGILRSVNDGTDLRKIIEPLLKSN